MTDWHQNIPLVLWITLGFSSGLFAQQESITRDTTTGFYSVTYFVTGDTLHTNTFFPGNLVDPELTASVEVDSATSRLVYHYEMKNREGAHDRIGLFAFAVELDATIDSVAVPNAEWSNGTMTDRFAGYPAVSWGHTDGVAGTGIPAGSTVTGFSFVTSGLPFLANGHARSLALVNWKEEGPFGEIRAEIDSLAEATRLVPLFTIGPRDPPSTLKELIDTLATYPSRAFNLGWIDSMSVADQIETALEELSDDFAAEDSAHAVGLIRRTLDFVESQKDSTLTSEAYALFKFNLEYALGFLPEVLPP